MHCTTTRPGHATNLTGVKCALALRDDPYRAPVPARVVAVAGERVTLELAGGTIEARCHDAARLAVLLDAGAAPAALFTAHEHQLLVEVDPDAGTSIPGTTYIAPSSSTGAYVAFNLALPWHADVPCGVAGASSAAGAAGAGEVNR